MQYVLLFVCLVVAQPIFAEEAAYKAEPGPFSVQTAEKVTLIDKERKKERIVRVYYPKGDGPFPVLIFSHGSFAGIDAFASVSKHWVSHGYVAIHPQHADARQTGDDAERPQLGAGALKNLSTGLADQVKNRVQDISAVIDLLDDLAKAIPELKGKMDKQKIGVSGHSYGACVAMLIGGATVEANGKTQSYADPRVKCILPISAAGTGEYGLTKESWKNANLPTFYITGTKDLRPGHEASWRKEPFELSPAKNKYLLIIEGANHFSFGGGPARVGGLLGRTDPYQSLVQTSSVCFWDAYLKELPEAQKFLQKDGGLAKFVGKKAELLMK